ncbi:ABC transporter ATP-binding protein [Desulforegula conservatrix]|uniref:ABC transporter ATP-binding protein n=1 Tax=Desulforegula conservatrix TaxID=153026 RepID=UPI0003FA739F|nr:ABC transporter ATP-binding protein [Desulforegula conservatrix]
MKNWFRKIFELQPRHRYLLNLILRHKYRLLFAMVFMMLSAAATAATAYLIQPALDDIFISKNMNKLILIPVVVVIVFVVKGGSMYGQAILMNYVGESIIRYFRDSLYSKMQELPLSFYQGKKTGELMSRITNDVNVIRGMVTSAVTRSLMDFFTVFFLIGVTFYQIWQLAFFSFAILPVAVFPIVHYGRKVRKVTTGCQESMADLTAMLQETFTGAKVVKAFGMEEYEKNKFSALTQRLFNLEIKNTRAKNMSSPIMEVFAGIAIAFVIWFGGASVIKGTYSTGQFMSFLASVMMLYDPIKKMSNMNNAIQEGMAAADRVFDILEAVPEIEDCAQPVSIKHSAHSVTFEDVYFRYDRDDVLRGINLHVNPGEVLALVGMSGGGKSSIVNLVPRFYEARSGRILIDNISVKDASIASLRSQIAIVTQEPILFNDTIRNNIAYGRPDASTEQIESAARAAFAHDFIERFPKGYETNIGDLGARLSGGERQRICIARALLKDAPILILDEATSSLDSEAEILVQKALENLMKGRTTFVIAHRLSTIVNADRIAVVVAGKVAEEGRHDELLAAQGEYSKLYQMQYGRNMETGMLQSDEFVTGTD